MQASNGILVAQVQQPPLCSSHSAFLASLLPCPRHLTMSYQEEAARVILEYLLNNVHAVRVLEEMRVKVCSWSAAGRSHTYSLVQVRNDPSAEEHYERLRASRDRAEKTEETTRGYYDLMERIGFQLNRISQAFEIASNEPRIFDMCAAPGGLLAVAMERNPTALVTAFSLPLDMGGGPILVPEKSRLDAKFIDITMLAEDMGVSNIPANHPQAADFLPRQLETGRVYDLAICDGHAGETQRQLEHRKHCETERLFSIQLVLSLERLKDGGTMVVLLHKAEAPNTIEVLQQFERFSTVRLVKPKAAHAIRSSFYLVAKDIQVEHPAAIQAVAGWKRTWEVATFGSIEDYAALMHRDAAHGQKLVDEYVAPVLAGKAKTIWSIQSQALERKFSGANATSTSAPYQVRGTGRRWGGRR